LAIVIAGSLWLNLSESSPKNRPFLDELASSSPAATSPNPRFGPEVETQPQTPFTFFEATNKSTRPSVKTSLRSSNALTYSNYQNTRFKQQTKKAYPFYVARKEWNSETKRYEFYRTGMQGTERVIKNDIRRYFLSENQNDYPKPESGCGPTALLNLYIWYSKFGLIKESIRHANPERYKQLKFREIDRKIAEIQGHARDPATGTNTLEQVMAIDEIVQANSTTPLRIHFEFKAPPLNTQDFIKLSRNYRAGILAVRPKDRQTGLLLGYHAVLVIRGDTSGKISIANWGKFSHGRLIKKSDGQWFIPDTPTQHELLIDQLITLIPFTPHG
jgi:hypothetical protein